MYFRDTKKKRKEFFKFISTKKIRKNNFYAKLANVHANVGKQTSRLRRRMSLKINIIVVMLINVGRSSIEEVNRNLESLNWLSDNVFRGHARKICFIFSVSSAREFIDSRLKRDSYLGCMVIDEDSSQLFFVRQRFWVWRVWWRLWTSNFRWVTPRTYQTWWVWFSLSFFQQS